VTALEGDDALERVILTDADGSAAVGEGSAAVRSVHEYLAFNR
jgi:hypothetical protein